MTDQNTFLETIDSVKEIIRTAPEPMSEEEILKYFADMELTEEQKSMILSFLQDPANYVETVEEEKEESETAGDLDVKALDDSLQDTENSRILQMYLEELSLLPSYTEEELSAMYSKLLQGDMGMVEQLLAAWLKPVLETAKRYLEPKVNVEDLIQEGNMALLLKLQELCGTMDKLEVADALQQAVETGIAAYVMELRDAHEWEDAMTGRVSLLHEAQKVLQEEYGRMPTNEELSEYTKIPKEELMGLLDLMEEGKQAGMAR